MLYLLVADLGCVVLSNGFLLLLFLQYSIFRLAVSCFSPPGMFFVPDLSRFRDSCLISSQTTPLAGGSEYVCNGSHPILDEVNMCFQRLKLPRITSPREKTVLHTAHDYPHVYFFYKLQDIESPWFLTSLTGFQGQSEMLRTCQFSAKQS